jgi:hypothetical protein
VAGAPGLQREPETFPAGGNGPERPILPPIREVLTYEATLVDVCKASGVSRIFFMKTIG